MPYKFPKPTSYLLKVKRTKAGLGLFADESIPRTQFVIEYFGRILRDEEVNYRSGKYLFEINNNLTIDGRTRENKARYINHSCKPNCRTDVFGKRMFVFTKRMIEPGEELSYDYGKEYFDEFIKPNGCKCGNH